MRILISTSLILLSLTACGFNKESNEHQDSANINAKVNQNIKFEVSSFSIDYKEESTNTLYSETYTGKGIITANGDENLVKKPYLVLIDVKKTSGGSNKYNNEGVKTIIVNNGIGEFTTNDYQFDKRNDKMQKPNYEIKIVGYLPFVEQVVDSK